MSVSLILRKIFPSKLILGCQVSTPMLERFTLLETRWGKLRLHHFLRSDEDRDLHSHPWSYTSLVLAGGYVEHCPNKRLRDLLEVGDRAASAFGFPEPSRERFVARPGMLLRRPSWWAHRVELEPGRDAWTLIWMSRRTAPWGFFTASGWVPWRRYQSIAGCISDGELAEVHTK